MTQSQTIEITCPKCGEAISAVIWTSVNTRTDPDEAQWLIDGFLFECTCDRCGNVATLNHDCLYHDPDAKALVQLVAKVERLEEAQAALGAYRQDGYAVRVVSSRPALREKAAMLRDGLDDRAVELLKFLAFNKFAADGEVGAGDTAYYGALADDRAIVIEFIGEGAPRETEIPHDLYENALRQVQVLDSDLREAVAVDRPWAARAIEQISARGEAE